MTTDNKIYQHLYLAELTCQIIGETSKGYKVRQYEAKKGKRTAKIKISFYNLSDFHGDRAIWKEEDWLFVGTFPTCYSYADRRKETNGDYHRILRIFFSPLKLEVLDHSPKYQVVIDKATAHYEEIKNNIDTPLVVSGSGQTVQPCL